MVVDTHTATSGTHYWSDPNAWTHTEAGHIPTDGDAVAIPTGCTIYFDADHSSAGDNFTTGINGIVITTTGSLHFAIANVAIATFSPIAYPNGTHTPYLRMKDATNISGTGSIYVGDYPYVPQKGTAVEDACVVKYTTWPATGTAIDNEMSAATTYDGVAADNDYVLQSSGATSFVFNDTTDYVYVPHGAAVDNLGAFTFEYGLYWNAATTNGRFFSKGNFLFYITSAGVVWLVRYDVGNVAFKRWYTTTALSVGGYYYIQIAWDSSSVSNTPTVKINNVPQTLAASDSGSTTAWTNDSAYNFYLESESSRTTWYNGTIYLFRLHSRVLTDAELTQNFNYDAWRFPASYIPRPSTPADPYKQNATIQLGTTGHITNTGGQFFYGWIPSAVAASYDANGVPLSGPAFTKIATYTSTTQFTLADTALELQLGEQIVIGGKVTVGPAADKPSVYTVQSDNAGAIVLTGAMASPTRAAGEYVAIFSRPILIWKAAFDTTKNSVVAGTMQGVRIKNMVYTSSSATSTTAAWSFTGCTVDGQNAACGLFNSGANVTAIDCVSTYITAYAVVSGYNCYIKNCIFFNSSYGADYNLDQGVIIGCVGQNNSLGWGHGAMESKYINCLNLSTTTGIQNAASCIFINFTATTNTNDVNVGRGYNTFYSCYIDGTIANYATPLRASWAPIQSYSHDGTTGYNKFWGRGGTGLTVTNAPTTYSGVYTMKFIVDGTVTNKPLIWDTTFWMPKNKQITFRVPMYAITDEGLSGAVWIMSPINDPLWYNQLTAPGTPTVGNAAGQVLAISVMPTPDTTWHDVNVTIPAQAAAGYLTCRIIFMGTTVSKIGYAYLEFMEDALKRSKARFA